MLLIQNCVLFNCPIIIIGLSLFGNADIYLLPFMKKRVKTVHFLFQIATKYRILMSGLTVDSVAFRHAYSTVVM